MRAAAKTAPTGPKVLEKRFLFPYATPFQSARIVDVIIDNLFFVCCVRVKSCEGRDRARRLLGRSIGCSLLGGLAVSSLLVSLGSSILSSLSSSSGGLSFLNETGEELLVLSSSISGGLGALILVSLHDLLSSDTLVGDESLDSWGLVVGLVTLGDSSVVHVSTNIVGLLEVEVSTDVVSSLLGETVVLRLVSESGDVLLSSLDNAEGNDSKVWSTDATTDRLSLSLSSSSWLVKSATYS